ncbi:MAG: hypothetical protein K2K58_02570 [Muribaculaceae bacterium]|nr:hypothetical protein [Muribaculaceae bacterium]
MGWIRCRVRPVFLIAISGLPIFALTGIFFALNISFIGFYQSIEKSLKALILTLLRGVIPDDFPLPSEIIIASTFVSSKITKSFHYNENFL